MFIFLCHPKWRLLPSCPYHWKFSGAATAGVNLICGRPVVNSEKCFIRLHEKIYGCGCDLPQPITIAKWKHSRRQTVKLFSILSANELEDRDLMIRLCLLENAGLCNWALSSDVVGHLMLGSRQWASDFYHMLFHCTVMWLAALV